MKKILSYAAAILVALTFTAVAAVDNVRVSSSLVTTAASTNTYVVRGVVEGVVVQIPATKTGGVSIVTASGYTLFSKSGLTSATDGLFPIRVPTYSPAASLLVSADSTNVYGQVAVAEAVTFTVTPADNTTGTNTFTAELIVNK